MDAEEFMADEPMWRTYLIANREEPGEISERALVGYEELTLCELKGMAS